MLGYSMPPPWSGSRATVSVRYGNGPSNDSRSAIAVVVHALSSSPGTSAPGSTPVVTRVPPGVVTSVVVKEPAATATSRATGSCDVQVRRPSRGTEGSARAPVIRTVRSSGADTVTTVSATGLDAVSPLRATNGSSAQPTPGSHASSGAPLPHQEAWSSTPNRSKAPPPRDSAKSNSTSVD